MDECEFEITSTEGPVDAETQKFDTIIGALEDSERRVLRTAGQFCRAKCVFEDTEETSSSTRPSSTSTPRRWRLR